MEGFMSRRVAELVSDSFELAALAAFLTMIAGVARWLGA
jgi:hypothetical protein